MRRNGLSILLAGIMLTTALTACGSLEEPDNGISLEAKPIQEASSEEQTESDIIIQPETKEESEETEKPEKVEASVNIESETAVYDEVEGDAYSYYIEKYRQILDSYYYVLTEQWGVEDLLGEGFSTLNTYCNQQENSLENVGFAFVDMDGDGGYELLLGAIAGDEFVDRAVFEMYTLENDIPVQVFCAQERDMYYITSEEEGGYFIVNTASAGAGLSSCSHYRLSGTELIVNQVIIAESDGETTNWYMAYDTDWDTSNDSGIDEELATAVIDSMKSNIILPDYISFSLYNPSR